MFLVLLLLLLFPNCLFLSCPVAGLFRSMGLRLSLILSWKACLSDRAMFKGFKELVAVEAFESTDLVGADTNAPVKELVL